MENLVPISKFVVVVWWAFIGTAPVKAYEASVRSSAECGEAIALLAEDFASGGKHDRVMWAVCGVQVEMVEERHP